MSNYTCKEVIISNNKVIGLGYSDSTGKLYRSPLETIKYLGGKLHNFPLHGLSEEVPDALESICSVRNVDIKHIETLDFKQLYQSLYKFYTDKRLSITFEKLSKTRFNLLEAKLNLLNTRFEIINKNVIAVEHSESNIVILYASTELYLVGSERQLPNYIGSIDFNNVSTKYCYSFEYMFNNVKLDDINVSNLDTSNIISIGSMFSNCSALSCTIDMRKWNTDNLLLVDSLFSNFIGSRILLPKLGKNIKHFKKAFIGCYVDYLEFGEFYTPHIDNNYTAFMFSKVSELKCSKDVAEKLSNNTGVKKIITI